MPSGRRSRRKRVLGAHAPPKIGFKAYQKARRDEHDRLGLCRYCLDPALPGQRQCQYHRDYNAGRRAEKTRKGICRLCPAKSVKDKQLCRLHLDMKEADKWDARMAP